MRAAADDDDDDDSDDTSLHAAAPFASVEPVAAGA